MKTTIFVIIAILSGVFLGLYDLIPEFFKFNDPSIYILYILLFCVGISVGSDKELLSKLKDQKPILLLVPIITIIGTLLGVIFVSPLLSNRSVLDCLAVGSGFGYYSLSSILISEYKGADLGIIALMSNIIREVSVQIGRASCRERVLRLV